MPLALLSAGETGTVKSLKGKEEVIHHLQNLGFAPGAEVSVVGSNGNGIILAIKGSRIALDRSLATKIMVTK